VRPDVSRAHPCRESPRPVHEISRANHVCWRTLGVGLQEVEIGEAMLFYVFRPGVPVIEKWRSRGSSATLLMIVDKAEAGIGVDAPCHGQP
jgi:hypothetical protein